MQDETPNPPPLWVQILLALIAVSVLGGSIALELTR